MNALTNILKNELSKVYHRIMNDECELDEEQIELLLNALMHVPLSKDQACNEVLHWSRSKFDDYVARRLMPAGRKRRGWKELVWYKDEILASAKALEKCKM